MPRPLLDVVLFLDECMGRYKIADALRAQKLVVEVFLDHFASGALDPSWLPVVGQKGWIVLTLDDKIRKHELEIQALIDGGVAAFVLKHGTPQEMSSAIFAAYARIQKTVRDIRRPFVARLSRTGVISPLTQFVRQASIRRDKEADSGKTEA